MDAGPFAVQAGQVLHESHVMRATRMTSTTRRLLLLLLAVAPLRSTALFADEAGARDFLVAGAGHGPVRTAVQVEVVADAAATATDAIATTTPTTTTAILVTSDAFWHTPSTSCHVAGRDAVSGALVWRRTVCSAAAAPRGYTVAMDATWNAVATLDASGRLSMWAASNGNLLWTLEVPDEDAVEVWFSKSGSQLAVGSKIQNTRAYDTTTGTSTDHGKIWEDRPATVNMLATPACAEMTSRPSVTYDAKDGVSLQTSFALDATVSPLLTEHDMPTLLTSLTCTPDGATFLVTTTRGTTAVLAVGDTGGTVLWTAQEGLSQVSAALLLDDSSPTVVDAADLKASPPEHALSFTARLQSQVHILLNTITDTHSTTARDEFFGFRKIALLLSPTVHRLYGMDTLGDTRGTLRYTVDLPGDNGVLWHRLVRGSSNAPSATHGIGGGGPPSKEVLVVTAHAASVSYTCVDGTTGGTVVQGAVPLTARISQVVPLASHGPCRQAAAVVLDDGHVAILPADDVTKADALAYFGAAGFYSHTVHKGKSTVESVVLQATTDDASATALVMGTTAFPGESIVAVAYPTRDEMVQSPCQAMGDQSLLLKYMNPHLMVVVTSSRTEGLVDPYASLLNNLPAQKRKPTGAGTAAEAAPVVLDEPPPNLFINVLDTVSGRVLHRASHTSAVLRPAPQVLISENWIFYSFMNGKTKRSEIGVLSLYEGKIEPKGLTVFSTPDRSTTFSSVDAKENKPYVFAKTYSMVKAITALGMSSTGGGISSRRVLVATLAGQIMGIDRKMLEPRRPLGKVNDAEQKEGLRQYDEFIPAVSLMSLSHANTVEGVTHIATAATDLESQTLMLAYGGPDLFFSRSSPSRGFDLLPESFNRILVSVVTLGLLLVLYGIKDRVSKKIKDQGWI
jgi:hypothetical protein